MRILFTIILCLFLTGWTGLSAQDVEFNIPDLTFECDDQIIVPITIETDVTLFSYQFSVTWDVNVLQYTGFQNINAGAVTVGPMNPINRVVLSGNFPGMPPSNEQTFQAGDVLINLVFQAVGSATMPSPINMPLSSPTPEIIASGGIPANYIPNPGSVIISDMIAPDFINNCPDINATADGDCQTVVNHTQIATDNCDTNVDIIYSIPPPAQFPVGTTAVTATATDNNGQSTTCTFNVIVTEGNGDGAPTIPDCPSNDITAMAAPNATSANVSNLAINPEDCDDLTTTYTLTLPNGTIVNGTGNDASGDFPIGTTVVNYSVSDGTQVTNCQFNVVVSAANTADFEVFAIANNPDCGQAGFVDVFVNNHNNIGGFSFEMNWNPSVITYTSNLAITDRIAGASIGPEPVEAGRLVFSRSDANTPNLPTPTLLFRINYDLVGGAGSSTPITFINLNAVTPIGDPATLTAQNTIFTIGSDNEPPIVNCPPDGQVITATAPNGQTTAIINGIAASATDNCVSPVNINYTAIFQGPPTSTSTGIGHLDGTAFEIGTTDVTYSFSDGINPAIECMFQVIVSPSNPNPGEVTFSIENVPPVPCGTDQIMINILADNLVDVGGFQFSLEITDESVFTFNSISNIAFPSAYSGPTGSLDSPSIFTWEDVQNGLGFPSGAGILFSITLDITGTPGEGSNIEFGTAVLTRVFDRIGNEIPSNVLSTPAISIAPDNEPPFFTNCPQDITVDCGDSTTPEDTGGFATADDLCSNNVTVTGPVDIENINDCGVGTITRTYTAADNNGQTATCTQLITIEAPELEAVCISNPLTVTLDDNNTAVVTTTDIDNGSNGGCGTLLLGFVGNNTFDCSNLGDDNIVTLIVTDECGTTATCTANINVQANVNGGGLLMIECPLAASITCNDDIDDLSLTGTATATDDCAVTPPTVTYIDDTSTLNGCNVGTFTRTWTATSGNEMQSCTQMITITPEAVIANCSNINVQLDENGTASITPADIDNNSTGGCGDLDIVLDINTFDCTNIGNNTVTLTVTDDCMTTNVCTATVTVLTANDITIICPADVTVNCNDGIFPTDIGQATANDACNNPISNITFTDNPMNVQNCAGEITRTWIATDDSGNSTTCQQIISIQADDINAVCQDITVSLDDNGMASITAEQINANSNGGCGQLSYNATPSTFNTSNIGGNNVTLTVTDACNSESTCIAVVTITDQQVPMIQCPMPVVTAADLDSCNALVSNLELIVTSDLNQIASIVYTLTGDTEGSGTGDASGFYNVGVTSVTYTANGTNGQSSTCTFSVTVNDEQAPVFNDCPDDISLSIQAGSCDTLVSWTEPTVTENCSIDMIIKSHEPGDMFTVGTTNVTYVAVDEAGNTDTCSFNIIITEPTPPTIACPENITVAADLNTCSTVVNWEAPIAMDNCGMVSMTGSHESGTDFSVGTTTVTYTATDISNNTTTCTFDISVNDEQAPSFDDCPDDLILEIVTAGRCDTMINWEIPTISDNCSEDVILTTSHQPNGIFPVGTTMVEYIATDDAGNADTCRFNIIITGNTIQNDFCPPSNSFPTMEGTCEAIVTWDEPSFSSECSSLSVESSHQSGDIFPVGTTTIEYVAIDTFGNSDTCRFDITVRDVEMPMIEGCPTDTVISTAPGSCDVNYFWTLNITDNCGILAVDSTHSSGDVFELGETEVVYSIVDVNGNATFCTFTVTVRDTTGPAINCPEPIEVGIDGSIISDPNTFITNTTSNDCNSVNLEFDMPTATDDCSSVTITQTDVTGLESGSTFFIGLNTLTYTAVDTFGNTTTCDVVINVQSFEAIIPEITNTEPCEGEFVKFSISQEDEVDGGIYTWTGPDGEEYDGIVLSIEMVGLEDSGTWTVTIVDMNGCTSSGTFEIIVHPTPDVVASASNTFFCGVGDESLQLMAEDIANAGVVEWCWQTPNRGVICEQNPLISNLHSEDAGMYIVTATTDAGCMDFDTVTINIPGVDGPILPTLVATPDELCLDEINNTTTLIGTSYFGDNIQYHWSATPSENAGITDINANINTATPTGVGDYTYQYWVTDSGCSTDTAEVLVHVEQAAPIEIQMEGETDCVSGQDDITLTAITDLIIANTPTITCTWIYPDGSTASPGDVLELPNATSAQSGSYTVICRTAVGCESSNTIVLDITDETIAPELNMEDDLICIGKPFNLNVLTEYDPTANYQWTAEPMEGSGLPGIATPSSLAVTPTESGTYTYSLVVTVDGCTSIEGQVSGTVVDSPIASLATMPTSLECVELGTSLTLVESGGTATTWTWETPRGTFTGNNVVLENITVTDSGIYSVTVSNEAGCSSETVTTMIIVTGALSAPSIKGPESICEGDDISGDMLCIAEPVLGATYTWTGPNGALSATGPCLTINNVTAFNSGAYTVVCELSGCSSPVSEIFDLVVLDAPMLTNDELPAFVGLSTVFDATDNDDLHTDNFTVEIIVKTSKGTLINEGDGSFTYTPNDGEFGVDNFVYEICYTDCPDNCDMATVALDIQFPNDECRPTTVVSPNGDGKNDSFIITCLESDLYPNNSLVIYNRWGDQVYQAAPYFNDWDARYEGETLPDGTYYFIFMREPNDPDPIKSFITVHK